MDHGGDTYRSKYSLKDTDIYDFTDIDFQQLMFNNWRWLESIFHII